MKSGSWPSILAVYALGICGGSTVSKIVPLSGDFHARFGLATADFGWLVALVAVPAALLAIPSGTVVDRLGPKRVLLLAATVGILANLVYVAAPSLAFIRAARLLDGLAIVHIYTAGPAMLLASTAGDRRTRAMTLWSTYAPVGTAVGLATGGLFAETAGWRGTFAIHAAMYAVAGALCLLQPRLAPASRAPQETLAARLRELRGAFLRPMLLILSLSFFLMISMGLGANVTLPAYLAEVHHVSLQVASNMVASTTIAMVLGSLAAGLLLPRGVPATRFFAGIAALGLLAGALSFYPAVPISWRPLVLLIWFVITGAGLATILATLPAVADPARPGSAAALINFMGAVATFINPPLWLGVVGNGDWRAFLVLLMVGWAGALTFLYLALRLSRRRAHSPTIEPPRPAPAT